MPSDVSSFLQETEQGGGYVDAKLKSKKNLSSLPELRRPNRFSVVKYLFSPLPRPRIIVNNCPGSHRLALIHRQVELEFPVLTSNDNLRSVSLVM